MSEKPETPLDREAHAALKRVIEKAYLDGYDAALSSARAFRIHCTWGPGATPDFALQHGIDSLREALVRGRPGATNDDLRRLPASLSTPED